MNDLIKSHMKFFLYFIQRLIKLYKYFYALNNFFFSIMSSNLINYLKKIMVT